MKNDMYREKIEAWFEGKRASITEDVSRLVAVESVRGEAAPGAPFGAGPAAALAEAGRIAGRLGIAMRNVDGYAGTFEKGEGEPYLSLLAHLDTVEIGSGWTKEPLRCVLENGLLYGRGTSDDKGPAVAALYALAAASEIAPLKKRARVVLGTAEETGSEDMLYFFGHEKLSPFTFSPDADFPVINIEKGRFAPVFSGKWESGGALPRVRCVKGGSTANVVPQSAFALIEGMDEDRADSLCELLGEYAEGVEFSVSSECGLTKITASGKNAHAAAPSEGKNAQTALVFLLAHMPFPDSPSFRALSALNRLFPYGDDEGAYLGIKTSDELSGPLTLAFTVLDMDLEGFRAQFDCRFPLCCKGREMTEQVKARLAAEGFETEADFRFSEPHHTPAESPFVQELLAAYESWTGLTGECLAIGGGTYVHDIPGGVAFGCAMPGEDTRIHGPDEFISVDNLLLSAKIFTQVILDLCAEKENR